MYWMDGAVRALDGNRRGLSDHYPLSEDPPGVTPYEIVHESGKVRLRHYAARGNAHRTPLVFVYALIKRPFILDMFPGRSVMANLTRQGFDVYMVEWIPPARADSWRGFDAYVNQDLGDTMRAVQRLTGEPKVNLLGYCFGGLLTTLYAALHPGDIKNLITLTTPFDTAVDDNPLFNLESRFSGQTVDLITSVYGNCPAWFIRGLFTATAVVHHAVDKYVALYRNKEKEDYAEFFDLFERWMSGDVPLAGRIFREVTRDFFQNNLLKKGEFKVGGERVDLSNIVCPLLNAIGEFDDVVYPASSLPLIDFVGSEDKHNLTFAAGHVGMIVSSAAHKKFWPQVGAWLTERD
jgi:polyhydroxyalkanoate synthase